MNVKVIYRSRKGHTAMVAEEIAKHCGTEALDITEPHTLGETDLLFIGTGIYNSRPDELLMDYLDQLPVNKIRGAAIFSTHRNAQDRTALAVNLLEHKGITVFPERFVCLQPYLMRNKDRPNKDDVRNVLVFTERVLSSFNG